MAHGIIFTGMDSWVVFGRPAGAYRMRTWLEQNGYQVEVVDFLNHFTKREIRKLCKKFIKADTLFVGVSATFFYSVDKVNFLFETIKKEYPNVKTVVGGTEGDTTDLNMNVVDRFIWGYAEEATLHYLDFLTGKRTDDLNWINYRGSLAINAEEGYKIDSSNIAINWKKEDSINGNFLPIEISRGCIFRCRFCQFPLLGKKKNDYIRHEDNLADELKRNYELFGVNNYSFSDDTFNDSMIKLEYVANAIAKSGIKITYSCFLRADLLASHPEMIPLLAETGIVGAQFGIETLNETAKKAVGKNMENEKQFDAIRVLKRRTPTYTTTGMIIGLPGETIESCYSSQEWFMKQNGEVFDSWAWFPLALRINSMTRRSDFDLHYKQWGYTIENEDEFRTIWRNDYVSFAEAQEVAAIFNNETFQSKTFRQQNYGMWHVSALLSNGYSLDDIVNDKIEPQVYESLLEKELENIANYKKDRLPKSIVTKIKNVFFK